MVGGGNLMTAPYLEDDWWRQFDADVPVTLRHDSGYELTRTRTIKEHFLLGQQVATW